MSREPNSLSTLLAACMRPFSAVAAILQCDFKLKREGGKLRVVTTQLHEPSRLTSQLAPATSMPQMDPQVQGMHAELRGLLRQHQRTRDLMRHLSYIERALRLGGDRALDDIPLEVLVKGLAQLKTLVTDWHRPGVAELRSRLSILIAAKEDELRAKQPANSRLPDPFTTTRLQVSEGTPSDFRDAAQEWNVPADR